MDTQALREKERENDGISAADAFQTLCTGFANYSHRCQGTAILYIKQKMFKFKEHVEVFRDASQQEKLFDIRADRIIDFSASYSFTAADGSTWGSVRRRGGDPFGSLL